MEQRLIAAEQLQMDGLHEEAESAFVSLVEDAAAARAVFVEARCFLGLARIAVAAGQYDEAAGYANRGVGAAKLLGEDALETEIRNQLALALVYQGEYAGALSQWQLCLDRDKAGGDAEGQAIRLSNIGGVYDYQGRYSEALRSYQAALDLAASHQGSPWANRRRQIAQINIATLFQRIGQTERALDLYQAVLAEGVELPASERARMLGNVGALYRHLGDPVKALDVYREAQELYRTERHSRGEISVLNNIGLAEGFDLGRVEDALATFGKAERQARETSDRRKAIRAHLHMAELQRRAGRSDEAVSGYREVVRQARELGTPDELWRGLYGLARIAEASQDADSARDFYEQALQQIESVRSLLDSPSLQSEFLFDKDDVYDDLIEWHVQRLEADATNKPAAAEFDQVLRLIQQQQGRLLYEQFHRRLLTRQDNAVSETFGRLSDLRAAMSELWRKRLQSGGKETSAGFEDLAKLEQEFLRAEAEYHAERGDSPRSAPGLTEIQSGLPPETILLSVWIGREWYAVLWMTNDEWGLVRSPDADKVIETAAQLRTSFRRFTAPGWEPLAAEVGHLLLSRIPPISERRVQRAMVVGDAAIHGIPFEVLGIPSADQKETGLRLIDVAAVSYLPSVALVAESRDSRRSWRLPFTTFGLAFADPLGDSADAEQHRTSEPGALPLARTEVAAIASLLPGRVRIHEGRRARKDVLLRGIAKAPAVVHLATHAVADLRNSDYSRILLAPPHADGRPDYLFLAEISALDLREIELVTLSACETERGRASAGEGVQAFGRSLLAAGADTAVTTLWRVSDLATAAFMGDFYSRLAAGETKVDALRNTKAAWLRSDGERGHPYFWAPYVLWGVGDEPLPTSIGGAKLWSAIALTLLLLGLAAFRFRGQTRDP